MAEHPPPDGQPLSAEELAGLFGFAPDALAANRAGRLSDEQRQDLLYRSIGYLVRGLVMLTLGATLIAMTYPLARAGWEGALWIGMCVLWLALGALWLAAARDVARPQVRVASGTLRRTGDPSHPAITVNNVTLRVYYRRWKRLPGVFPGRYRAYYEPARALLSIEPAAEDTET
jgi:hypothetical protein